MIITIDGLSGTGKSTVARMLAKKLNFVYFDTGAMYRAFTWKLLKDQTNIQNMKQVEKSLQDFSFEIKDQDHHRKYFVGDHDVTHEIRRPEVTAFVSQVAAIGHVRAYLVEIQREFAHQVDAVFEGRDMGTVVFPDADLKIFLNAKAEVRAQRRLKELYEKFPNSTFELSQILQAMKKRDFHDSSREISPLKKAEDAHEIDTSQISIDQVIEQILELKKKLVFR